MSNFVTIGTYADFIIAAEDLLTGVGTNVAYLDLTGSSGPFYVYGVDSTGAALVRVKLDAKPGSFSTDFPNAHQLRWL